MELNKQNRRSIMLLISFTVLLYLGVSNIGMIPKYIASFFNIITPIIVGCALAFILNAPMRRIEALIFTKPWAQYNPWRVRLSRPLSLLLTLLLAFGIFFGIMFLVIPELVLTISSLANHIPKFFTTLEEWLNGLGAQMPQLQTMVEKYNIDMGSLGQKLLVLLQNLVTSLLNNSVNFSVSLLSFITDFVLGFFLAIYILVQKEKLGRQMRELLYSFLPEKIVDRSLAIASLANNTFSSFVNGQMLEAFILGCIFLLAMNLFGFPYALLVSCLIMLFAMIPMLGAFIACFIGFILILTVSPGQAFWFVAMFIVIQQLEGNLLYPRVVGKSVGLSPIWVLVAVIIGGALGGVLGMLVSIPTISVLYTLMSDAVHERLQKRKVPYYKTHKNL